MSYPDTKDVSKFFTDLSESIETKLVKSTEAIECYLSNGNRTVRLKWFEQNPEEFWFSMHESDRCDLVDWTEMFEGEKKENLFEYIKTVSMRYLCNETRVTKKWLFFGTQKLQYFKNHKWHDLRSPI